MKVFVSALFLLGAAGVASVCTPGDKTFCYSRGICTESGERCYCFNYQHYWPSERCSIWHEGRELQAGFYCYPGEKDSYCSWRGVCTADGSACVCDDPDHHSPYDRCKGWHSAPTPAPAPPSVNCIPSDTAYCNNNGKCDDLGDSCLCNDYMHFWPSEQCSTWHEGRELEDGWYCYPNQKDSYCSYRGTCSKDGTICVCDDPHYRGDERCSEYHSQVPPSPTPFDPCGCNGQGRCAADGVSCECYSYHNYPSENCAIWHEYEQLQDGWYCYVKEWYRNYMCTWCSEVVMGIVLWLAIVVIWRGLIACCKNVPGLRGKFTLHGVVITNDNIREQLASEIGRKMRWTSEESYSHSGLLLEHMYHISGSNELAYMLLADPFNGFLNLATIGHQTESLMDMRVIKYQLFPSSLCGHYHSRFQIEHDSIFFIAVHLMGVRCRDLDPKELESIQWYNRGYIPNEVIVLSVQTTDHRNASTSGSLNHRWYDCNILWRDVVWNFALDSRMFKPYCEFSDNCQHMQQRALQRLGLLTPVSFCCDTVISGDLDASAGREPNSSREAALCLQCFCWPLSQALGSFRYLLGRLYRPIKNLWKRIWEGYNDIPSNDSIGNCLMRVCDCVTRLCICGYCLTIFRNMRGRICEFQRKPTDVNIRYQHQHGTVNL